MLRFTLLAAPPALLALALVVSCGDDDPAPGPSSSEADAGHAGHDSAAPFVDAGISNEPADAAIRCTDDELAANDRTDGGALELVFARGANPVQYTNHCATVKAGASVTLSGSFRQHPLEPAGGDRPNPIPRTESDQTSGSLVVPMPTPGLFGFQCEFHPTLMYGAIRVVP